jgi:subfamily B ATP-binding cassette protein MsbA
MKATAYLKTYNRALSFFFSDWQRILGMLVLIGLIVCLATILAWPMAILLDVVLSTTPKTGFIYDLFKAITPKDPVLRIAALAGIYIGAKFLLDLLSCLKAMLNNSIKYRGTVRVRRVFFKHLQALGFAYHNSQPQGDVIFRLSNDTFGPFGIFDTIFSTGQQFATLVAITAAMLTRQVPLTIFALALTPLMLWINWYFGPRIKRCADDSRQIDADLMTTVQRSLSTIHLIHAYNRQPHEIDRYTTSLNKNVRAAMRLNWQENLYPLVIQCVYGLGQAVLLGLGGYLVYRDQMATTPVANGMTCGDLVLFMAYFSQLLNPLSEVAGFSARVKTSVAACERVFRVLDRKPEIADAPDALDLPVKPRTLHIHNLTFGYDPARTVIQNVHARIRPGEMVAFIGPSGAGKSTLLNLIPRFYDPSAGGIYLDGRDLRRLKLSSVRQHIVIVSQDYGLLAGTVAENLRYGNLAATDRQMLQAAELAGAAEFIETLPEKYETRINEGGKNLSGGQRQRLAIARALLSEAPILIFDEPTSALDPQTEQHVALTLANLKGKRTIIIVTHRLASVDACDQIYVFQSGRIVEHGTYAQLLMKKSFAVLPEMFPAGKKMPDEAA